MTQIAPLTIDTADAATAATLKAVKAKLGVVPNLLATLAHAPAALNGYLGLSETLGTGRLSARSPRSRPPLRHRRAQTGTRAGLEAGRNLR